MTVLQNAPLKSLEEGNWFKLICGASFQHLPAVRSLTIAYTLAGADCIDVAADPAVIAAAQEGLHVASLFVKQAREKGFLASESLPLLMVSINDGEDPHFRKATFNYTQCPPNCSRPCERVCPTQAIVFERHQDKYSGVLAEKCYGCGRCIPICPYDKIYTSSYVSTPGAVAPLVLSMGVDAVEIHTRVGREQEFKRLWQSIAPWLNRLKLVAVSCPDDKGFIEYLKSIYDLMSPLPGALIWQTDGRPMSGDIGSGTTLATVKLGQKVLTAKLPGYVQLAGGTNSYTVAKIKAMGMLRTSMWDGRKGFTSNNSSNFFELSENFPKSPYIAGVAYGSYARVLLSPVLQKLEDKEVNNHSDRAIVRLEEEPDLLWQAVELAHSLVSQLKLQQER